MGIKNKSKITGNENITTQIQTQNIIYQQPIITNSKYKPDEKAIRLLKETIEDDKNNYIIYVKTLSGRTIQCGNGRFSVNSSAVGEKEMEYWEDSFNNLIKFGYIGDVGNKGEVFKILKQGYEYYDNNIKKDIVEKNNFTLNDIHIKILKMFRDNDYCLWEYDLNGFFKTDIDYEIAFNELLESEYILDCMVAASDMGSSYCLNSSKKMEVLKILKQFEN